MEAEGSGGRGSFRERDYGEVKNPSEDMNRQNRARSASPARGTSPAFPSSEEADWRPAAMSSPCDQRVRRMIADRSGSQLAFGGSRVRRAWDRDAILSEGSIHLAMTSSEAVGVGLKQQQQQQEPPAPPSSPPPMVRIKTEVNDNDMPGGSSGFNEPSSGAMNRPEMSTPVARASASSTVAQRLGASDAMELSTPGSNSLSKKPPHQATPRPSKNSTAATGSASAAMEISTPGGSSLSHKLAHQSTPRPPRNSMAAAGSASAAGPSGATKILNPATGQPSSYSGGMHSHFHRTEGQEGGNYGTNWGPYGGRALRCWKCGLEGHGGHDCHDNRDTRRCFNCNEVGHLKKNCPHPKRDGGRFGNSNHNSNHRGNQGQSQQPQQQQHRQGNHNVHNSPSHNNSDRNRNKPKGQKRRRSSPEPGNPTVQTQSDAADHENNAPSVSMEVLAGRFKRLSPSEPRTPSPKKVRRGNRNQRQPADQDARRGRGDVNHTEDQQGIHRGQSTAGASLMGPPPIPQAQKASTASKPGAHKAGDSPNKRTVMQARDQDENTHASLEQRGQNMQSQRSVANGPVQHGIGISAKNSPSKIDTSSSASGDAQTGPSGLVRQAPPPRSIPDVSQPSRVRQQPQQTTSHEMQVDEPSPGRRRQTGGKKVIDLTDDDTVMEERTAVKSQQLANVLHVSITSSPSKAPKRNPATDEPAGFEQSERKVFILAKCAQLEPPMYEEELLGCPDYRAAILRNYPPTSNFWLTLKKKLLDWRADQRRAVQVAATLSKMDSRPSRGPADSAATNNPPTGPRPSAVKASPIRAARRSVADPSATGSASPGTTANLNSTQVHPLLAAGSRLTPKQRKVLEVALRSNHKLDKVGMATSRLYLTLCGISKEMGTKVMLSDFIAIYKELPPDDPLRSLFSPTESLTCDRCGAKFNFKGLVVHFGKEHNISSTTTLNQMFSRIEPAFLADLSAEKQAIWKELGAIGN